jgi:hypothetical protein
VTEPRSCNRWQPVANRAPLRAPNSSQNGCRELRPLAESSAWEGGGCLTRQLVDYEAPTVNDGSWAFAHLGDGRFDRERLIGATLPQWPAWVAGTALGVLVAPSPRLTSSLGLDVVFPAFFLLLLLDEVRTSSRVRAAALASTTLAALLTWMLPAGLVVVLSTLIVLIAVSTIDRR